MALFDVQAARFAVAVLISAISGAQAEPLPTYEGVYAETGAGFTELHPLAAFDGKWKPIFFFDDTPIVGCIDMMCIPHLTTRYISYTAVINAPVISPSTLVDFAKNGSGNEIVSLTAVVPLSDYLAGQEDRLRYYAAATGPDGASYFGKGNLSNGWQTPGTLVVTGWGFHMESGGLHKRNIDQFNAKYDIDGGANSAIAFLTGALKPYDEKVEDAQHGPLSPVQVCPGGCRPLLFILTTETGIYPFFTPDGRKRFAERFGLPG